MNKNEIAILNEVKKQIERFDLKASILSAVAGILLGMSFGWIPVFKNIFNSTMITIKYFLIVFIFLYIFLLSLAIVLFVWSILPRSKPKRINKIQTNNSIWYYKDLQKMSVENIKQEILKSKIDNLSEQIKINSIIASKKHNFLVLGIWFLFLSTASIFISIILYIFI